MSHSPVKFGLVGAGAIAQSYADAFEATGLAKLVGVADVRADVAAALGQRLGCAGFASHSEMVEKTKPEAVVICTPPCTHRNLAVELMQQGLHVLCEKPLSIDVESAHEMLDAAQKAEVQFTMASKFRYVEDVIRAKHIVMSGILGDVMLFENAFTAHVDMSKRWNSDPRISGGGVLIDNGTHSVDIMRYFLGPLAELQVIEGKRPQNLRVEDTVRIFVRSQAGVMGSIDLSWSIKKELPSYINIYGTEGSVSVGWKSSQYRRRIDDEWVVFGSGYDKRQAFQRQIENFAKAIRGEEMLLITPADALASVEVIQAAYDSLSHNHWTAVAGNALPKALANGTAPAGVIG